MEVWEKLTKPSLLLNTKIAKANLRRMAEKAQRLNLSFRPHFKTHQSAKVGDWFRAFNVEKIAVSSLEMAEYFAENGWQDILVAFPVNLREIATIHRLAEKIQLGLLVSTPNSATLLAHHMHTAVDVWLEIDAGYPRSGIPSSDLPAILEAIKTINVAKWLNFKGLLIHNGHAYKARGASAILEIHATALERIQTLKTALKAHNVGDFLISLGDTPCCSIAEDFTGIDEIRPGNFIFYDMMQAQIGSCDVEDIAVALACPVVAIYPQRNEVIVFGGGVHLSKDSITLENGEISFGAIVLPQQNGWGPLLSEAYVKSISQEHGTLRLPSAVLENLKLGDLLGILPVHSCMTADLMRGYDLIGTENDGQLQEEWLPMMKAQAI